MMPIGRRDGKQKHLLQEALPIFAQEGVLHDLIVWKTKIYQHCEDNINKMGRKGKLSIILFLPIMNLLLNVLQKMSSRIY